MDQAETVICTFRVKDDSIGKFMELVLKHHPTLQSLDLVTDTPPQLFMGEDQGGPGPVVVQIFEWVNSEASSKAHTHPEVAAIWEAREPLGESRYGMPSMDFPHFQPVAVA